MQIHDPHDMEYQRMVLRIPIIKTYKLFIGGAFPRSESGRVFEVTSSKGKTVVGQASRASRKDLRDAVVAARTAWNGWNSKSAFNRGQILYRLAEMLEHRSSEMMDELTHSTGASPAMARREIQSSVDRLIWYAGWADKLTVFAGGINPVSSPHFNFSIPESSGVVCVIAPDQPSLLGLISVIAPVIVSGNTCIGLASEAHPLPSITFAEMLATSDLPAGVVNLLTGFRSELAPHMATHMDINALVDASGDPVLKRQLQIESACNLKRASFRDLKSADWFSEKGQDPYWMMDTMEIKTTWHPIGW